MADDEDTTVGELRREIAAFVREREWDQFHDPKNLAMAIATEAAELMNHFRWIRNDPSRELARDPAARAQITEELADVVAFVLSFANTAGIDITSALRAKMAKNARKYPADQYKGKY